MSFDHTNTCWGCGIGLQSVLFRGLSREPYCETCFVERCDKLVSVSEFVGFSLSGGKVVTSSAEGNHTPMTIETITEAMASLGTLAGKSAGQQLGPMYPLPSPETVSLPQIFPPIRPMLIPPSPIVNITMPEAWEFDRKAIALNIRLGAACRALEKTTNSIQRTSLKKCIARLRHKLNHRMAVLTPNRIVVEANTDKKFLNYTPCAPRGPRV